MINRHSVSTTTLIIFFLVLLCPFGSHAQSTKQQIEELKQQIQAIQMQTQQQIDQLKQKIQQLENTKAQMDQNIAQINQKQVAAEDAWYNKFLAKYDSGFVFEAKDKSGIPFKMRFSVLAQVQGYVNDTTGQSVATSMKMRRLEIKWDGYAFAPWMYYTFMIDPTKSANQYNAQAPQSSLDAYMNPDILKVVNEASPFVKNLYLNQYRNAYQGSPQYLASQAALKRQDTVINALQAGAGSQAGKGILGNTDIPAYIYGTQAFTSPELQSRAALGVGLSENTKRQVAYSYQSQLAKEASARALSNALTVKGSPSYADLNPQSGTAGIGQGMNTGALNYVDKQLANQSIDNDKFGKYNPPTGLQPATFIPNADGAWIKNRTNEIFSNQKKKNPQSAYNQAVSELETQKQQQQQQYYQERNIIPLGVNTPVSNTQTQAPPSYTPSTQSNAQQKSKSAITGVGCQ